MFVRISTYLSTQNIWPIREGLVNGDQFQCVIDKPQFEFEVSVSFGMVNQAHWNPTNRQMS